MAGRSHLAINKNRLYGHWSLQWAHPCGGSGYRFDPPVRTFKTKKEAVKLRKLFYDTWDRNLLIPTVWELLDEEDAVYEGPCEKPAKSSKKRRVGSSTG